MTERTWMVRLQQYRLPVKEWVGEAAAEDDAIDKALRAKDLYPGHGLGPIAVQINGGTWEVLDYYRTCGPK